MRVLVCGGRDYGDADRIYSVLDDLRANVGVDLLIQGGARGADSIAAAWADERGIPVEQYEADWSAHGKAAGPIRNQRMIDEGKPEICVAFPGGRGTADMVARAKTAGILVRWDSTDKDA